MSAQTNSPLVDGQDLSTFIYWAFPGSTTANDNSYVTADVNAGEISCNLLSFSCGFSIPLTATIVGIVVRVYRDCPTTGGSYSAVSDYSVKLTLSGGVIGNNKAAGGSWGAESDVTYGTGIADMWGLSLTPADVNDYTFGTAIAVQGTGGSVAATARIDFIEITIYYSEGATGQLLTQTTCYQLGPAIEDEEPSTARGFLYGVPIPDPPQPYLWAAAYWQSEHEWLDDDEESTALGSVVGSSGVIVPPIADVPFIFVCRYDARPDWDELESSESIGLLPVLLIADGVICGCAGSIQLADFGHGTISYEHDIVDGIVAATAGTLQLVSIGTGTITKVCEC